MIFRRKVEDKVAERVATKVFEDFSQKQAAKQHKTSTIKDILNNPDDYELLARVEDGEVVIRIRKPFTMKSNYTISQEIFEELSHKKEITGDGRN